LSNQKGNHLVASIKHIEATSPLAVNGNALVIGDKLIVGLNALCIVAVSVILEEGEFLVGHTEGGGLLYFIYHGIYFFKSIIIWRGPGDSGGPTHINIVEVSFPYPLIYLVKLTSTVKTPRAGVHILK